jgi:hypothetical protein
MEMTELQRDVEHIEEVLAQNLRNEVLAWRKARIAATWNDRDGRCSCRAARLCRSEKTKSGRLIMQYHLYTKRGCGGFGVIAETAREAFANEDGHSEERTYSRTLWEWSSRLSVRSPKVRTAHLRTSLNRRYLSKSRRRQGDRPSNLCCVPGASIRRIPSPSPHGSMAVIGNENACRAPAFL